MSIDNKMVCIKRDNRDINDGRFVKSPIIHEIVTVDGGMTDNDGVWISLIEYPESWFDKTCFRKLDTDFVNEILSKIKEEEFV